MVGNGEGAELVELFEKASKAADRAVADAEVVAAEEARCIEALKAMGTLPVSTSLLMSTQVGKQLRKLTKSPSRKIGNAAQDLLDAWKKVVATEAALKNGTSPGANKSPSPKQDSQAAKSTSMVVKAEKVTHSKVEAKVTKVESKVQINSSSRVSVSPAAAPSPSGAGPKLGNIPKSGGDPTRDRVRELLVEALAKVCNEATDKDLERARTIDPIKVAVSVENAMFFSFGKEKNKYRSIMFNLKDANNPDFRRRVLLGEIKPEEIVVMTAEDMASDQRKKENDEIKAKALFECERGLKQLESTDQFKCSKCKQRKTTYFQLQTRSADEPMTTYVTCVNCNHHWKFC
ncbi:hypothetical protein CY35_12G091000 [Sphagnum magellanicum]|nr:hypothetical protein CY35_12G091000 [Sphagnum magellanicum]KAH9546347.1 hypothetical protein CY35_12G091000 [Sphagnum magellanicum]